MDMGGVGGWGMGLGWFFMVLFWVLIVLGIAALVRYLQGPKPPSDERQRTPLQILQERYARGEIDREEYEQKRRDLQP